MERRYEVDEYVHEEFGPESTNLNRVCSYPQLDHPRNATEFKIQLPNGWEFSVDTSSPRMGLVREKIRQIERWPKSLQMTDLVTQLKNDDSPQSLHFELHKKVHGDAPVPVIALNRVA
jgi:hypothetical protein